MSVGGIGGSGALPPGMGPLEPNVQARVKVQKAEVNAIASVFGPKVRSDAAALDAALSAYAKDPTPANLKKVEDAQTTFIKGMQAFIDKMPPDEQAGMDPTLVKYMESSANRGFPWD